MWLTHLWKTLTSVLSFIVYLRAEGSQGLPARGSAGGKALDPGLGSGGAHWGPQPCSGASLWCPLISFLLQESKPEQGLAGESHSTGEQPPPLSMATRYRARRLGVAAPFWFQGQGTGLVGAAGTVLAEQHGLGPGGPGGGPGFHRLSFVEGRGAMC